MAYSQNVKQFHEEVIEDYNRSLEVEDVSRVRTCERGDGSFIQVGRRVKIPEEVFESFVHSFGREVAIGEMNFLLESILENKDIEHIIVKESGDFIKHLSFNNAVVVLSTKFYVDVFSKLIDRVEYGKGHPLLYGSIPLISFPEKILGNNFIILEKGSIFLDKELFTDEITGKKEKINVITKPLPGFDVEVLVRSVLKIRDMDVSKIKVLEVKDG